MYRKTALSAILVISILFCGCGSSGQHDQDEGPVSTASYSSGSAEADSSLVSISIDVPSGSYKSSYKAPPLLESSFHEDKAEGGNGVLIDLSATADGYVAVSAVAKKKLKFQAIKEDNTYNYDLASDGTPSVFPLQCGNGEYLFRVMENVTDNKYAELFSVKSKVKISDEFQPFLRPSSYISYSADSDCVKKAAELAKKAGTPLDVVKSVYAYICSSVVYDSEKAETVRSGYLPDPDETMRTGEGICFDYAALAAAMLRSQGIPTKMVFGYVSPGDLYHAWNMFYTEKTGWVTVSYEVKGKEWNRLDLTFSAGGADDSYIGDGENYGDLYYY